MRLYFLDVIKGCIKEISYFLNDPCHSCNGTGARGGTVMTGRGTANNEAEKLFNISIQPEKELVLIIVESGIRDAILRALYEGVGLGTPAQGIAFSLPVDNVVGMD